MIQMVHFGAKAVLDLMNGYLIVISRNYVDLRGIDRDVMQRNPKIFRDRDRRREVKRVVRNIERT
jgi:hypothetical protein